MNRPDNLIVFLIFCTGTLLAQESYLPDFHGFLTQALLYSNDNNYLAMNTSSASPGWTEAALNINEQLTGELRIGAQIHTTHLGSFGSWRPGLDWASADYKVQPWLGIRAGKVKIRWGLYNDVQDADQGYLWSLLPEPIYAVDWRATNLSQMGAELYGRVRLGRNDLEYSAYYGYYRYASDDGYLEGYRQQGLFFSNRPGGITPGFDLRWKTPVRGLKFGGSLMMYNARGALVNGTFRQPLTWWPAYYAQYDRSRFSFSAQYVTLVQPQVLTVDGTSSSSSTNTRSWFAMASYRATNRLQLGVYYTRNLLIGTDSSDPANRFRDSVISTRYDLTPFFYTKLEGHFIDGNALGFYNFDNPDGLRPHTRLLVAKIGFCF